MMGKQAEFDFDVERQTVFTLDDIEIDLGLELNITFIEKQADLHKALLWLQFSPPKIGIDIETTGLDCHVDDMIMLQFGDKHRQFVIDTRFVDVTPLKPYLFNDTTVLVGQNLKFEYKFFKQKLGVCIQKMEDTMIQEQLLYNGSNFRYSLKDIAKRYLNYEADKSIRLNFLTKGDKPFTKDEIIYGGYDVILPCLISEMQQVKIKEQNKQRLVDLEHEVTRTLGDIEHRGLFFNKEKWEALYYDNLKVFKEALKPLNAFIIDNNLTQFIEKQFDLFSEETKVSIKWTSSTQVVKLLRTFGACPMERNKTTKKLTYTVEAKVLKTSLNGLNKDQPEHVIKFIKDYIRFKELEQSVTTFGISFFKYINPVTGRLHSSYSQIINTGRMSSSAPNLQNIPADKKFRECFTAPEGYNIINADFSGQENIVLANKSLDKDLLEFYEKGNSDMHSFIASKIYKRPYEDYIEVTTKKDRGEKLNADNLTILIERGIAKAAGFAINYGGNGYTISKNLGIPSTEGDAVYDAYFEAFPGLRAYFDRVIADTLEKGYVTINEISNRTFILPMYDKMKKYEKMPSKKQEYLALKSQIGRKALNYPVQGTAGDITKAAAAKFRQWLISNNLFNKVYITNIVHDEINVECPKDISEKVAKGLEQCMSEAGSIWCKTVPLKAVAAIGSYWAH